MPLIKKSISKPPESAARAAPMFTLNDSADPIETANNAGAVAPQLKDSEVDSIRKRVPSRDNVNRFESVDTLKAVDSSSSLLAISSRSSDLHLTPSLPSNLNK
jgi:hypothetical protein